MVRLSSSMLTTFGVILILSSASEKSADEDSLGLRCWASAIALSKDQASNSPLRGDGAMLGVIGVMGAKVAMMK